MTISMKKIVISIVVLLIVGGIGYYGYSTKDERVAKAEIKTMIDYAQRQALEIAIIEQTSKLVDYRNQMAKASKPKPVPTAPVVDPDSKE